MDLSKEARALLNSAKMTDCAPNHIRRRARQRFVSAVAAGTIGTSAVIAQGATTGVSATLSASSSLTATMISAVVTGLSLGLVATAPTSTIEKPAVTTVLTARSTMQMAKAEPRARAATIAPNAPPSIEPQTPEISAPLENSGAAARTRAPAESARVQAPLDNGAPPIEVSPRASAVS